MIDSIDYKAFQKKLNEDFPDTPFTEEEAKAALRNLGEFVWLLHKINQREQIVTAEELTRDVAIE